MIMPICSSSSHGRELVMPKSKKTPGFSKSKFAKPAPAGPAAVGKKWEEGFPPFSFAPREKEQRHSSPVNFRRVSARI